MIEMVLMFAGVMALGLFATAIVVFLVANYFHD